MSTATDQRILIVGGGVIGLAVGWQLLRQGASVTLLEKGEVGKEASWAAAGMLAPYSEAYAHETRLFQLGVESVARYPAFVQAVQQDGKQMVNYVSHGTLSVALNADERSQLAYRFAQQQALDLPAQWLSGTEVLDKVGEISSHVVAGVWCAEEASVEPRSLLKALKQAFLQLGGVLHEHCPVEAVVPHAEPQATAPLIRGGGQAWQYDKVLLAAGCWLSQIEGMQALPIRPVKGQMLSLDGTAQPLACMVRASDVYLVPRVDGTIIVGATVEEQGYDKTLTAGAVMELLRGVWRVFPACYDMPLLETWCGLRPAARDHAPVLGKTAVPGLYVAGGHYRHGIMLTPITAEWMADLMLHNRTDERLLAFRPDRF